MTSAQEVAGNGKQRNHSPEVPDIGVSRGRWGGVLDGTSIKRKEDDVGRTRVDVTNGLALLELGVVYRVLGTALGKTPGVAIDLYGGRCPYLELDLDTATQPSVN